MKYDISKKATIGAKRTLTNLQQALLSSLCKKSFEEITVGELCEKAMLTRGTFYNYFEDKYDLLEYCFNIVRRKLDTGEKMGNCEERLNILMNNCFDFLDENQAIVLKVLQHNSPEQFLIKQIRFYLISGMLEVSRNNTEEHQYKVPAEMAANLYSQAILIILEWKYLNQKECSKEQAQKYLKQLVSGIDIK